MSPRGRSRGALISAAVSLRPPSPPRRSSVATDPRGCPRGPTFAAAVLRCCPRRQVALPLLSLVRGDVTPRLSVWGVDVRHGGGPPLPLLAARRRFSAVVTRPRPRWRTSAIPLCRFFVFRSAVGSIKYHLANKNAYFAWIGSLYYDSHYKS